MKMSQWAEQECRIACKRENPNFDFDGEEFDYGCSCYKSALKAYKSLMEDDHSGASFSYTKNILIKLMNGQPLTPITDEDFFSVERGTVAHPLESEEYLKERGLKSHLQCPRMCSLFREETLDGKVSYHDVDRAYYINLEEPSDTYGSWCGFIDDMFPIKMPYVPEKEPYRIYAQSFLVDKSHGDFDTRGIFYVITPSGEKVDINIFQTEGEGGKWKDITLEEYNELLKKRIDRLNVEIAEHLMWTLISNSSCDDEIDRREEKYKKIPQEEKDKYFEKLSKLCEFFENTNNYQYNTFSIHQALCRGEEEKYKDVPELVEIAKQLQHILEEVNYPNLKEGVLSNNLFKI